jgi:nucleoid DNA-binding protein
MIKEDLINYLSESSITYKISKKRLKTIVDEVFRLIIERFIQGEDVLIRGFGHFRIRYRKPHQLIHPSAKTPVMTHPKYQITFETARNIKRRLRNPTTKVS